MELKVISLAIVVLAAFACGAGSANKLPFDAPDALAKLCNDKDVDLFKISELKMVLKSLEERQPAESACRKEVREAILESAAVVENNEDVCSRQKTDSIGNFHFKYISTQAKDNLRKFAPKALRRFIIAYGLEVSRVCKKNMVNNLIGDSHALLGQADFELMRTFTDDKSGILARLNGKPDDFDDIVLASDLLHMHDVVGSDEAEEEAADESDKKIYMKSPTGSRIHEMQSGCRNRFKPFYDKLILPLVRLADLGYNYKGEDMQRELDEIKNNPEIGQWYSLVYFCEILLTVEIIQDPSEKATENPNKMEVEILTAEEVENSGLLESAVVRLDQPEATASLPLIQYQSSEGSTAIDDDVIIEEDDKNFIKLVRNFDASMTPFNRIKNKFFGRFGSLVKEFLSSGRLNIKNKLFPQVPGERAQKSGLVKAIETYVEKDNPDLLEMKGGHMCYGVKNPDGSVSQFKKKKIRKPWTGHRVRMLLLQVVLVVGAVIGLLCVLGVIG